MAKTKTKQVEAQDIEVLPVQTEVKSETAVELYAPVKAELSKYDTTDEWIKKKKEEYKGLIIAGVDDKDGYKVVHSAYMEIKNKLTEVEKTRKGLKDTWSLKPGEIIDDEAKRIKALLEPLRDELFETRDKIDKEKERLKKEEEKRKAEHLQARVVRLIGAGLVKQNDGSFSVRFSDQESDNHSIDAVSVAAYTDEQFEVFASLMEMKSAKKKEAEEKAKKDKEDELEKLRAENERLKAMIPELPPSPPTIEINSESGAMQFGLSLEKQVIGSESQVENDFLVGASPIQIFRALFDDEDIQNDQVKKIDLIIAFLGEIVSEIPNEASGRSALSKSKRKLRQDALHGISDTIDSLTAYKGLI